MSQSIGHARQNSLWKILEILAVMCFLSCLAVMFIQVAARYALGVAVPWTDETSRFLFIGAIFLGAAICQQRSTQIRVTVVLDLLPDRLRRWIEVVQAVFSAIAVAAVAVGCVEMAKNAAHMRAATLPITFAWLYALEGISLLLILFVCLRDIWRLLSVASGGISR